jgi:hypothetical protein
LALVLVLWFGVILKNNMQKICPQISHLLSLIFVLCCCFFFVSDIYASAPFVDSFDTYAPGNLAGQGGWDLGGTVITNPHYSAPYAVGTQDYLHRAGTVTTTGEWYFQLYYEPFTSGLISLKSMDLNCAWPYTDCGSIVFDIFPDGHVEAGGAMQGTITPYEWHTMGMKWSGGRAMVSIDGGNWSSDWDMGGAEIEGFNVYNTYGINFFIDDFALTGVILDYSGINPTLAATFPVDHTTNIVADITNFNVSGTITNPDGSKAVLDIFCVTFQDASSRFDVYNKCATHTVDVNSSWDYSFAVDTIPADAAYIVHYLAMGHDSGGNVVSFNWEPANTFLTHNTPIPASAYTPVSGTDWELPAQEDCNNYNDLTQKLLCNIRNMIEGIFIPSKSTLNNAQSTFSQFKNKFPFNYISAVVDMITAVHSGITNGAITFTLFGAAGTVDLSPLSDAGITPLIYAAILFMVLLGFGFWGVNYLNRIF